ncbi:MAG TPA: hypothetical protein VG347_01510 [Verrucomicrobiae bacterium]|nr:hypothetical protein [Verrucomicrobiae bacterium]
MREFVYTIQPGSGCSIVGGKVFTLKSATLPVYVVFDGGQERFSKSGRVYDFGGFSSGTILNRQTVAVDVIFFVGDKVADFAQDDNTVGNVKHRAYGNMGIGDGAAANGGLGLPACNALGYLQIGAAALLLVPGVNLGNTRQSITFDVAANSAANLQVKDLAGNTCQNIPPGQARLIVTDSQLRISGVGGTASVCITEIYQNKN